MRTLLQSEGSPAWLRIAQSAMIAAMAAAVVLLLSRSTAFSDFNQWTYDLAVDHAALRPPSSAVVLVDFDEATFDRIKLFPIPRSTVAEVVAKIGAQKPRVIGMDMFLSEPRTAAEDAAMRDALTNAGVVVLASQTGAGALPPVAPLPMFCQPEDPKAASGFCKDGTPGALGYAFVDMPVDADGFIRQANLLSPGNPPNISFPLFLAQQYSGQAIQPVDAKRASFLGHTFYYANPDYRTILIGSWSYSPATVVPAWKVLDGSVAPNAFADKLVLLGQSSDAARDTHFTPLFRVADKDGARLRMPGTQVHAAAIRTLLEGTTPRLASAAARWALIFGLCWGCSLAFFGLDLAAGLLLLAAALSAVFGASLLLFARAHLWLPFLPAQLSIALALPLTVGVRYFEEKLLAQDARDQRQRLMALFSSYVDPAVANTIWQRKDEVSLAGEQRTATVMFTDIRSFTALSAGQPPAKVLGWLNVYLAAMDEVIREHGGFLNKFIGDGLMILFGLPLSQGVRQDAARAMRASLAMLERVRTLNAEHADNPEFPQLRIGIGIHTGELMAGSIGSANRQEYSVIGETVNLASRLESLNKPFKTEILMSATTQALVVADYPGIEPLGDAKVAGFERPIAIFTIRWKLDGGESPLAAEQAEQREGAR